MAKKEVKQWITVNGVHVPIFEGESKQEAVERHYRKTAGKQETKIRNMDDNWTRKLSRGEKAAMQTEVERERKEAGNPVKLSWGKTHSKLDQHSEIQKMAEEHVRKIWTKGGVYNKELYDEADKFAEKHNLDKKKVRDAAIKAMNEKYADSLKRKKNGEDPVKFNESVSKDQDEKEKQIAENKRQAEQANGKKDTLEDAGKYFKYGSYSKSYTPRQFAEDEKIVEAYRHIDFDRSGSAYGDIKEKYEKARRRWQKQIQYSKTGRK